MDNTFEGMSDYDLLIQIEAEAVLHGDSREAEKCENLLQQQCA